MKLKKNINNNIDVSTIALKKYYYFYLMHILKKKLIIIKILM